MTDQEERELNGLYQGASAILEICRWMISRSDGKLAGVRGPEWQRMRDALARIEELAAQPVAGELASLRLRAIEQMAARALAGDAEVGCG